MPYKLESESPKQPTIGAESLHRLPAQAISGAAATFPGIFGDVASLLNDYVAGPASEFITGQKTVPYEETYIGKILPTTATHKKNLQEGIPYLKPKNKIEEFVNEVSSDAASIFFPAGALTKAGLRGSSLTKSFITSLGSNAMGKFVEDLTGDPQKGAYTKMGTMFLLSALNKPGAQKEISKLYQKADDMLPKNATVNAAQLESEMNSLKSRILNGRTIQDLAPSEKFVIDQSDIILRQIKNGQANVGTLKSALRSLNENLQKAVLDAPDKSSRVRARKLAKNINRSVNKTLEDYGKFNPEWWKNYKGANDAYGAMSQSNFITNFIQNNVKSGTVAAHLLHVLGVGAGSTGAVVPYQAAKLLYRISNSKELAKHYSRVISSAAAENASLMNQELKKLDEVLKKEEAKKPKYRLEN